MPAEVAAPPTLNFADVWEMAADAVGERTALVCGHRRRTYAELEERANRLAHHLAGRGVGPNDHVGLYLENCPEYLEAMLACFKLRAVPINVNHRYVAGELAHLLTDCGAVGVLHGPGHAAVPAEVLGDLDPVPWTLATGTGYDAALAAEPAGRPDRGGRSGDDRYVIYTGGHHRPAQGRGVAPGGRLLRLPGRRRPHAPVGRGQRPSALTAVVQPVPGASPTLDDLAGHCRAHLAGYKAPKHLVLVDAVVRSPAGKADHRWAQRTAAEAVARTSPP